MASLPRRFALLPLSWALLGSEPPPQALQALLNILETPVISGSRSLQKLSETAAVVSVITREDLLAGGYASVAEALRDVPGFYAVDDYVADNFGIRGVNAGMRAYSRILKVMIDDQPVAFRPDATHFLGPELIPLEAVERIEVIRGPASALYGANAFLGTVHIYTRRADLSSGTLGLRGRSSGGRAGSTAEAMGTLAHERLGLTLAASHSEWDRSGRELPASSPILLSRPPADRLSREDRTHPTSLYAKARWEASPGSFLQGSAAYSRLSTRAEWVDFGTLSHQNHLALRQAFVRLAGQIQLTRAWALSGSLAWSDHRPDPAEQLSASSSAVYPRREMGCRSWDGTLEGRYLPPSGLQVIAGVDYTRDDHDLLNIFLVQRATGEARPAGTLQGDRLISNVGVFLQVTSRPWHGTTLTANLRRDESNVTGGFTSYRLGVTHELSPGLFTKFLVGSAFKAPSPVQLYAQPLYAGELVGNPDLKPERARTWEAELGWQVTPQIAARVNLFYNQIRDGILLLPYLVNYRPANQGHLESRGAEGELRWSLDRHRLLASFSYQFSRQTSNLPFQPGSLPTALYPQTQALLRWQFRTAAAGSLELGARYVSPRRASESNQFFNYNRPYALGGHALLHGTWLLQTPSWRLQARVDNLLGRAYVQPGYGGYDLPDPGRVITLSAAWSF